MNFAAPQNIATVSTKLRPPRQKRQLLKREKLLRGFFRAMGLRLIMVSAPAGYGKTSILAQVFESLAIQRRQVAWISIDPDDNDLIRFFAHLIQAIRSCDVDVDVGQTGSLSQGSGYLPAVSALKETMVNQLGNLKHDLFLFLDDLHYITSPDVLEFISALMLAPLDKMHFIIASRSQPALPVARLRALGEVHEVSLHDLAFSSEETNAFMDGAGSVAISRVQAEQLCSRTEGWVASLQMAAIALQSSGDPMRFLSEFNGADRSVADFLMEEVIAKLPVETQQFLVATSILERFSSSLANAVLDRSDSRAIIDRLESLNLFLFSLDRERTWYRYHHLFSELLQKRLRESYAPEAQEYHRRACDWLESHGFGTEAIRHAFATDDFARAGALLDAVSPAMFAAGQAAVLRSYASRLPDGVLKALPRLQLELAWENEIQWRFDEAREGLEHVRSYLGTATGSVERDTEGFERAGVPWALIEAKLEHRDVMLKAFTDDLQGTIRAGMAWADRFGQSGPFMSGSVATALLMARRENFSCDLTRAEADTIRQQFLAGRATYGNVFLDTVVGSTSYMRGDLRGAEHSLREAQELAKQIQGERSMLAAMPAMQLADVFYEQNRLVEVRQLLGAYAELSPAFGVVDSVIARQITTANLARHDKNNDAAHHALDTATHIADRYHLERLHAYVLAQRVRMLIADGQAREAERVSLDPRYADGLKVITPSGDVNTAKEQFAIAAARLASERGETAQAITLIRRWLAWAHTRHCHRSAIRLAALLSNLYVRAGDVASARRSLVEALQWGRSGPFVRSYIDEGPAVIQLVEETASATLTTDALAIEHMHMLLRAAGRDPRLASEPVDPLPLHLEEVGVLSERELEILRLTGKSLATPEIAQALGLAESTVKWYWRRIFEKLGVHRRTAAVRTARQRGLIA